MTLRTTFRPRTKANVEAGVWQDGDTFIAAKTRPDGRARDGVRPVEPYLAQETTEHYADLAAKEAAGWGEGWWK